MRTARLTLIPVSLAVSLAGCAITPIPLTEAELGEAARDRLERVDRDQEPVVGEIGIYDAMARALKYNLDHRVEMMQIALAQRQSSSAGFDMLPRLAANAGYANRSNTAASYSRTMVSGITSAEPSTSSERANLAGDLTFSWHVLDFGLSYVRARQAADKALVQEELKRKVVNRIVEDVRTAYWRAVSADRLLSGFRALETRVVKAQANTRALRTAGRTSPLAALTFERELIDIKRNIQRFDRELADARHQLAALMNVRPGTPFKLVIPKRTLIELDISMTGDDMVELALRNRPEFRDLLYKERINRREATAALLEMLPGASVYAGLSFDTNAFLLNANWASWGLKAGWNLMQVLQYPARKAVVDAHAQVIDAQSLAMTMAIMTQVHVARSRYAHMRKSAATSAEYYEVQRRIRDQIRASVGASAESEQTLIREEMNTLVAAVEYDMAYADLQNAFATVFASIGIDPHGPDIDAGLPVAELAARLREAWRQRGDIGG